MDKKRYLKKGEQTFRIVGSKGSYSVEIYDFKSYMWRSADIFGKTLKECKEITRYVYGMHDPNESLEITIDYGYDHGDGYEESLEN